MKRFAQILTLATVATFAFASLAVAEIPTDSFADRFINAYDNDEQGPQVMGQASDTEMGAIPANLVFDNTQADFDKSRGYCASSSVEAGVTALEELTVLDELHGIGF
jgi:hypothetical protein|nr:hypothetical protein [Candidatus Krumholzibacteria bacterium]